MLMLVGAILAAFLVEEEALLGDKDVETSSSSSAALPLKLSTQRLALYRILNFAEPPLA